MCDGITNIVAVFVGAIISGIITWYVSKKFYIRAGKDLEKKASALIQKIDLILRGMEEAGHIEWTKDKQGNVKGIVIKLSGSINAKSEVKGKLTVTPKNNNENKPPNQP